jgi:hypothetical protein
MKFEVYGGFTIARKTNRHGVFDKEFWTQVRAVKEDLPDACGCYVFALQNGESIIAWYVGKTEKRTFANECFQATKVNYYNELLVGHNGTPRLFLLPRLTSSGTKFSKPTKRKSGYRDVDFLESMLIGIALERNRDLLNVRKTQLLREMVVPGIINTPQARPTGPVTDLRNALGRLTGKC